MVYDLMVFLVRIFLLYDFTYFKGVRCGISNYDNLESSFDVITTIEAHRIIVIHDLPDTNSSIRIRRLK